MKQSLKYIFIVVFAFAIFGITFIIDYNEKNNQGFDVFSNLENILTNLRFAVREKDTTDPNYTNPLISKESKIITIDQESLEVIGKWPWKRNTFADFLNKVEEFSPKQIHIDVLFNLEEEVPSLEELEEIDKQNIFNSKEVNVKQFSEYLKEFDNQFSRALERNDNVYIDQYLLQNRLSISDEAFIERLRLNENILSEQQLFPDFEVSAFYFSTDPLVEKFLVHARPVVINAVPDQDEVLRKATLVFPYKGLDNVTVYQSSVYLELAKRYFSIESKDITILEDRIILNNALAPILEPDNGDPQVSLVDFSDIEGKIVESKQKKYNHNLYNLYYILFNYRYSDDTFKTPDFPIKLQRLESDQYALINGAEIYNVAKDLGSKRVKVIFYERKDITMPLVRNRDNNPYSININYANREQQILSINNGETTEVISQRLFPTESFKDIYLNRKLPDLPKFSDINDISQKEKEQIENWFKNYVSYQENLLARKLFRTYGENNPSTFIKFALEENPYEGSFYFFNYYLNELGGSFDKENYKKFIVDFFKRNFLSTEHSLVEDFLLDENIAVNFLINEYISNYNKFYDQTLFLGAFTSGMARDVHRTPYNEMFGISTILNAYNTIIKQNFLKNSTDQDLYLSLAFVCLSFSFIYYFLKNYLKYIFFFVANFCILFISYMLFEFNNYLLYTTPLLFSNLLIFIFITLYVIIYEERDKKYLKNIFTNYLSPEVIDDVYKSKEEVKLGGEEKHITAFFTDIQGFSSFSEILTAEQLVELLNEYLGAMTDILLDAGGTLDKYEGDAIIAFYGAPLKIKDSAFKACKTAILMQEKLIELKEKWKNEKTNDSSRINKEVSEEVWGKGDKWPKLVHDMKMRIGINFGLIVVGNMGSEKRKNYTMMGDDVNLAARLESAAKQYGVYSVASEKTLNQEWEEKEEKFVTKDFFTYRLLDKVVVVGKKEVVKFYELISLKGEETEQQRKLMDAYNQGIDLYYKKDFPKALEYFQEAKKHEAHPDQRLNPSKIFVTRCETNIENLEYLVMSEWDGVHHLDAK